MKRLIKILGTILLALLGLALILLALPLIIVVLPISLFSNWIKERK